MVSKNFIDNFDLPLALVHKTQAFYRDCSVLHSSLNFDSSDFKFQMS